MINADLLAHINIVPKDEPFVCLYSGGKDSGLALSIAKENAPLLGLINCVDYKDSSMFHSHDRHLIDLQAQRIGTNVDYIETHWKDGIRLSRLLKKYKNMGAETVVFGDIWDEKNAEIKIRYAQACGLKPCMPLWKVRSDVLIDLIEQYQIISLITTIRSPLIENEWLGTPFNKDAFNCFSDLGIDPFGEKGEFHTSLIYTSCFAHPILYKNKRVVLEYDKFGVKTNCYFDFS